MLGYAWRLHAYNATDGALTDGNAFYRRWKFDTSGGLSYEGTEQTFALSTLAATTYIDQTANDNSTDDYLGFEGCFEVQSGTITSTGGDVTLWYQQQADTANTTEMDLEDGTGYVLGVLNFTTSEDSTDKVTPISYA